MLDDVFLIESLSHVAVQSSGRVSMPAVVTREHEPKSAGDFVQTHTARLCPQSC